MQLWPGQECFGIPVVKVPAHMDSGRPRFTV